MKALPHVGSARGESVCCAGVTEEGAWRRLFPVNFRRLPKEAKFERWQWVEYQWRWPTNDRRPESRHVQERTLRAGRRIKDSERAGFLVPLMDDGFQVAEENGKTLTLVRPIDPKFKAKRKPESVITRERVKNEFGAYQGSLFDKDVVPLAPCPFEFRFSFSTRDGREHDMQCADWETSTTFWRFENLYGEAEALRQVELKFGEEYPERGMAFAVGTHSLRPKQWLLVGVLRLNDEPQKGFSFT